MARKVVQTIICDRCKTQFQQSEDGVPLPAQENPEFSVTLDGVSVSYYDTCPPCKALIRGLVDRITNVTAEGGGAKPADAPKKPGPKPKTPAAAAPAATPPAAPPAASPAPSAPAAPAETPAPAAAPSAPPALVDPNDPFGVGPVGAAPSVLETF